MGGPLNKNGIWLLPICVSSKQETEQYTLFLLGGLGQLADTHVHSHVPVRIKGCDKRILNEPGVLPGSALMSPDANKSPIKESDILVCLSSTAMLFPKLWPLIMYSCTKYFNPLFYSKADDISITSPFLAFFDAF